MQEVERNSQEPPTTRRVSLNMDDSLPVVLVKK